MRLLFGIVVAIVMIGAPWAILVDLVQEPEMARKPEEQRPEDNVVDTPEGVEVAKNTINN
jgi:hypothetical protein